MKKWMLAVVSMSVIVAAVLLYLFIPLTEKTSKAYSAVMLNKETGQIETTTVTIDGQWSISRIFDQKLGFSGQFRVDALQYTLNDSWELDTEFEAIEGAPYFQGFLPYKSTQGSLESAVLYVNADHAAFVYYDAEYIVFAPAKNEDDAFLLCKAFGLNYPG